MGIPARTETWSGWLVALLRFPQIPWAHLQAAVGERVDRGVIGKLLAVLTQRVRVLRGVWNDSLPLVQRLRTSCSHRH